jgi:hypothetical protein
MRIDDELSSKTSKFHIQIFVDRQSWLFTGILPHGYSGPSSFCYDLLCSDPPIMVRNCLSTRYSLYRLNDSRMMKVCMTTMYRNVLKHSSERHTFKFAQKDILERRFSHKFCFYAL